VNDVVAKVFASTGVAVTKKPVDLTLIPWQRGKPLTWDTDVTVAHTLADCYTAL